MKEIVWKLICMKSFNLMIIKRSVNKLINYLFLCSLIMTIISCATIAALQPPATANAYGSRALILDGEKITADDVGGFTSWYCVDFIDGGPILVEVGFFGNSKYEGIGFVLFDGGYSGKLTSYERTGLEHRWDWGTRGDYSFIIKQDGTGLYFDFSSVKPGTSTKPRAMYKAYKR